VAAGAVVAAMPLIAWIANKIEEPWLRRGLWVAAPAVLAAVFDSGFPAGDRPIFNWLAYGLGVPTLSFIATAWLMRRASDLRLMLLLQGRRADPRLPADHAGDPASVPRRPSRARRSIAEAGTLTAVGVLALGTWRRRSGAGEARCAGSLWPGNGGGIADRRGHLGHGKRSVAPVDPRLADSQRRALRSAAGSRCSWRWRRRAGPSSIRRNGTRHHRRGGGDRLDWRTARARVNRHLFRARSSSQPELSALERCRVLRLLGRLADLWRADPASPSGAGRRRRATPRPSSCWSCSRYS
jgi:hypothetical protein